MRTFMLAAVLTVSVWANGQSTISLNCTPSCGTTTFAANSFAANGSGAGQVALTSGTVTSVPGSGYPTNTITLFAPAAPPLTTSYGISPTAASPASGFWYGILGSGATFGSVTLSGTSISGSSVSVGTGGSGYFTSPPCYFSGGSPSTPGTCTFSINGTGGINGVTINSGGSGYMSAPVVAVGPTLDLAYLPASDITNSLISGYSVQVAHGSFGINDLGMINGSGDLVDSGIAYNTVSILNMANTFTASNTFSSIVLSSSGTLDASSSTQPNALKTPSQAGLTSDGLSSIGYDTTGKLFHVPTNGADSTAIAETSTVTSAGYGLCSGANAGLYSPCTTFALGVVGGGVGGFTLYGSTSGNVPCVTNTTGGVIGCGGTYETTDSNAFVFSQTTSSTGSTGIRLGITGSGTTEAFDITGGTSTTLANLGNKCTSSSAVTLNTTATTICSWTLPNAANRWRWECDLHYNITTNASNNATLTLGMTAAQSPSFESGNAQIYTTNAGAFTEANAISFSSPTSGTNETILTGGSISGTGTFRAITTGVVAASATSGTFVITGRLGGSSPAGNITTSSSCMLF
jgi:hypothetical protein